MYLNRIITLNMNRLQDEFDTRLSSKLSQEPDRRRYMTYSGLATLIFLILTILFYLSAAIIEPSSDSYEIIRDDGVSINAEDDSPKFIPQEDDEDATQVQNVTVIDKKKVFGEKFHDRSKVPDAFDKIDVGLRIMPSQNDEGGILFMPLVNEKGDHDSSIKKGVNSSAGYFVFDKTQDYFP